MTLRMLAAALAFLALSAGGAMAQSGTARMVTAANAFLATLTAPQRQKVSFAFDDAQQRTRWSNLPVTMVPRAGLNMGELTAPQRIAAMALVSAALSARGYQKVQEIMEGDETLKAGGRAGMFGKELYFISILGMPWATSPWTSRHTKLLSPCPVSNNTVGLPLPVQNRFNRRLPSTAINFPGCM